MNFCILSVGVSNVWIILFTLITFSTTLIISAVTLITKATEKNKRPKSKKIIFLTILYSLLISSIFYSLATRSLFSYEVDKEDYNQVKKYLKNYKKEDVIINKMGTKILLCKRNNITDEMRNIIKEVNKENYISYENVICLGKESCKIKK